MTATFADQGNASNGGVIEVSYVENRVKTEPMLYGLLFLVTNVEATIDTTATFADQGNASNDGVIEASHVENRGKPNPCSMDFFFSRS